MPRYIIKIHDDRDNKDYYMEWSTVVDAPVTYGMYLDSFKSYYKEKYGSNGMQGLQDRLENVEQSGTSEHNAKVEEYFAFNRAGKKESCIGKEEILERYCRQQLA